MSRTAVGKTGVSARLKERAIHAPGETALITWSARDSVVWTWAELEHVTGHIADAILSAAEIAGPCAVLMRPGQGASGLCDLIGLLRTRVPGAVLARTAAQSGEEALVHDLHRSGRRVIYLADGCIRLADDSIAARDPLPACSLLIPTGGSTGKPKLVIDEWIRTVDVRPRAVRPSSVMHWRPGQRQVVVGPLHHAAALTFLVEGLTDGNMLLIPQEFDADDVLNAIGQWRAEWMQLTPFYMRHFALRVDRGHHDLSSLRALLHMGAPCQDYLKRYWIKHIGEHHIFEMYGATEGIGVTLATGKEWSQRPGTVGRGFFTQIRILDSARCEMEPDQEGDIFMRAGALTRRLYLRSTERPRFTADGFATVGDRGKLDADGYLYLASRQFGRIQVGDETVDPTDVEAVLRSHPNVIDAAVVGIPNGRLGASLVAFVVAREQADLRHLRAHLRSHLSRHQIPRALRFVEQLLYTEAGKVDRRRLTELAALTPTSGHQAGLGRTLDAPTEDVR